jgi:hypothetical protein
MRKDSIKQHIDSKILREFYSQKTPEQIRLELMETCNKFEKNITERVFFLNEKEIENIKDVRSRYLSLYIYFAQQRIIDLYKVETRDIYGWNYTKKFKAILFKEKLESKATTF